MGGAQSTKDEYIRFVYLAADAGGRALMFGR
jgi:hypothetical protein